MLFAYNEDGTLEVVADLAAAREHFESDDVESGAIRLFDERGRALKPLFPERIERKLLGIRVDAVLGPFDLVPDDAPDATSLAEVLGEANVLMPNEWFADFAAIRAHLDRAAA